jgi:hypothetical protein
MTLNFEYMIFSLLFDTDILSEESGRNFALNALQEPGITLSKYMTNWQTGHQKPNRPLCENSLFYAYCIFEQDRLVICLLYAC